LDISARRSITDVINTPTFSNYYQRSFQDTEISANSADKSTNSDFFYDYTAKLLFDLNDKHSFRANIIGINNDLNYAEYANEDQNESKVSQLSKESRIRRKLEAQWTNAFRTEIVTYFSRYITLTDYRVPTDQLTEANEVLETGTKLNANYKANSN
jgi:hypothetical protein